MIVDVDTVVDAFGIEWNRKPFSSVQYLLRLR